MGFLARFEAFHDMAVEATNLDDFGTGDYREPMRLMLTDYDRYCQFTPTGASMIAAEIVGRLVGRLLTQRGLAANPSAAKLPIVRPLIIFGMPRTGTTTLHRLLAQDPGLQFLPLWLGAMPMPRPPRDTWASNPCFRQIAAGLEQGYALDPGLRSLHPMEVDEPDECRFALSQSFWAADATSCANIPDYSKWVLGCDARFAFRYYRRVLNIIAAGDQRRWLLKDVDHLFGLDSLIAEFPDACFIQTHREPITALTSVASLIYRLRRLREVGLMPEQHGAHILATWAAAQDRAEKVRQTCDQGRFIDIHNNDIHADPIGTASRIYQHFGLSVTDEVRLAWAQRIEAHPTSGHGVHHYVAADFGFTPHIIASAIGAYNERYHSVARGAPSE